MDLKILSAVFVSVAALASGINTGSIQPSDVRNADLDNPAQASVSDFIPNSFDLLSRFVQRPEPKKSVRIVAVSDSSDPLTVRNAELEVLDMENYTGGSLDIRSDSQIVFTGFSGKIRFVNGTSFSGNAGGFHSSGVNVSERVKVDSSVERPLYVKNSGRTRLKIPSGSFEVSSDSTSTAVENSSLNINSFAGDLTFFPGNSTIVLDGKIDRLTAGDLTISAD